MNEFKLLFEPQPKWEEEPCKTETPREWVGRYRYLRKGHDSEPEVDVDVDVNYAPEKHPDAVPIQIDGNWYWKITSVTVHSATQERTAP